jgi:tetratricopeptide (TPR) repeat protein
MAMKTVAPLMIILLGVTWSAWGLEGLQVGMKAPGFSLRDLAGSNVRFADLKESKLIVLTFFAMWSESSAELLERLEKLSQQYARQGLVVVGINVESLRISPEEEAAVKSMVQDRGLSFSILVDRGLETFRSYGVVAVPSTVVIDKQGTIVGELVGYPLAFREDLFDLIEATFTGKKRSRKVTKTGYQPQAKAVRYYNLARALVTRGSVDMAEINLKRAIESDAKFASPLILLGQLFKMRAQTDETIEFQGQAYTTVFFSQEERQQSLTEAAGLFRKALEIDPGNAAAMTELGTLLAQQQQKAEAEKLLQQALKTNPSYTPAYCSIGSLFLKRGNEPGARQAFEQATQLNPLDYTCYLAFARAYEEKGMQKQAVALYRKSLELLWSSREELFPFSFAR